MASTVFHERFGEVTRAQLAAYRRYNVSQSDHGFLVERFGEESHAEIVQAVKAYSPGGNFSFYALFNS